MKCPSCGHENDPGNRFCEFCGARLDPNVVQEPTVSGPSPFIENDASYDAPTMFVPSEEAGAAISPAEQSVDSLLGAQPKSTPTPIEPAENGDQTVKCHVCGYENNASDRFCEQCGASLETVASPEPTPAITQDSSSVESTPEAVLTTSDDQAPSATDTETEVQAPAPVSLHGDPRGFAEEESPLADALADATQTTSEESAPVIDTSEPISMPTAEADEALDIDTQASTTADSSTSDTERERLNASIQEHRDNLEMFQQMATRYTGRDMPAHIQSGLDESQRSLSSAEQALADYDAARSQQALPDPAERERLETALQEHRDNLAMFQQMATRYAGRDMPAHIQTGLDESQRAMDQAQTDLDILRGDSETPAQTIEPKQTIEPVEMPQTEPELVAETPTLEPETQTETPVVQAEAEVTPVAGPYFTVKSSGQQLNLPTDKTEIIIGREDPISGIFPDVDLTKHGGETGGVSREHAKLHRTGDHWNVEDLNSTNYTRVNDTKVEPGTRHILNNGDTLSVGRVMLVFHSA